MYKCLYVMNCNSSSATECSRLKACFIVKLCCLFVLFHFQIFRYDEESLKMCYGGVKPFRLHAVTSFPR